MSLSKLSVVALVAGALYASGARAADSTAMERLYGDGVHAYFAGDSFGAFNSLNAAVQAGTRDPRVFYFRGLAEMRLGREPDAQADFEHGGALEASEANGYAVGQALERIQGSSRSTLEQYRESGRMAAMQQTAKPVAGTADSSSGPVVLRRDTALPPPEVTATPPAAAGAKPATPPANDPFAPVAKPADAAASDPFSADAKKPADKSADAPGDQPADKPAVPAAEKPAATPDQPAATDKPAADSPFDAAKPATPAEKPAAPATPAEKPAKPAEAAADPFGAGADATMPKDKPAAPAVKPAADDPFGTGDAAKPADKPAAKPAAPADDKPAADKPAADKPAADKPATDKPADKAADKTADVKPTKGALGGIFRAFAGALPDNTPPAGAAPALGGATTALPTAPNGAPPAGFGPPAATPPATAPATVPGTAPAAIPPGATPTTKSANPFGDEPTPGKPAVDAKTPAADSDPFGLNKPDKGVGGEDMKEMKK